MADAISEELRQNWNVCQFRATSPEQMLKKREKKLDTSVVQLQTAIIEATTELIYHPLHEFPLDKQKRKADRGNEERK